MTDTTTTAITVYVESEPHDIDLTTVIRPAPKGGSFMIYHRVPRSVWEQMRNAGANYLSEDDLEDMDMFHSRPGWRYGSTAMLVLIQHGYVLHIYDQEIRTAEEFTALWTAEAKTARRAASEHAKIDAARAKAEREAAEKADRERKAKEYEVWQNEHLAGLVYTTASPPDTEWQRIAFFGRTTPGAWYDTGDCWYKSIVDGKTVYKRIYGNATVYYAPQDFVDKWLLESERNKETSANHALYILRIHETGYECLGYDTARRLIEIRGIQYYITIAQQAQPDEIMLEQPSTGTNETIDLCQRYCIPHTIFSTVYDTPDLRRKIQDAGLVSPGEWLLQTEDGRMFKKTYSKPPQPLSLKEVRHVELIVSPPVLSQEVQKELNKLKTDLAKQRKANIAAAAAERGINVNTYWSKERLIQEIMQQEHAARIEAQIQAEIEKI